MPLLVLAPQLWAGPLRCSFTLLRLRPQAWAQTTSGGRGHFPFRLSLIQSPWDVELLFRDPRIPQPALLQGLLWGLVCSFSPQEVPVRLLSKELVTGGCVCRLFP